MSKKGYKRPPFSEEWKKNIGLAAQGRIPWNKGKKGLIKPNSGSFKKGNMPWNKGLKGFLSADKHYNWKGEIFKHSEGYVHIFYPNHPRVWNSRVRRTWLVAEKYLGRYLRKKEVTHHINGDKSDDRPENLYVFSSELKHRKYHQSKNRPILISNVFRKIMVK